MVFPALALLLGAFFVWLCVRLLNIRERWAKRSLLTLVATAALYPLSFGPACAAWSQNRLSDETFIAAYGPLVGLLHRCPRKVRVGFGHWAAFCGACDIPIFFLI